VLKQDPQHSSRDLRCVLECIGLCNYKVYNKLIMLLFLENCAVLGYYAASSGNFLPTFWNNLSVLFQGQWFKNPAVQIRS